MTKGIYKAGLYNYAMALIGFGTIQLVFGQWMKRFFPGIRADSIGAYITGAILITAGAALLFNRWRKYAALAVAVLFLVLLLYPHLPRLTGDIYDPNKWTVFFQLVACCAGALLIAGRTLASRMSWVVATGRYAFAMCLLVFGIQHFLYADFIQTLIPGWIPSPLLWSWLIRLAFIATAISFTTGILIRLSGLLSGFMFLSWVLLFHIPKVAADANNETEWTNLFIALALAGTCFLLPVVINNQSIKKKVST